MELAKPSERAVTRRTSRLNRLIQLTMLSGLIPSMLLMLIGSVLYFLQGSVGSAVPVATGGILAALAAGNPLAFMHLGMILLMMTPALSVLVAAVGYLIERDRVFALVSVGVAVVLATSVLIGSA